VKIRIFDSAKLDLADGYFFYEEQESGIGQYFLDSLYSDIDSLALYAGIHPKKTEPRNALIATYSGKLWTAIFTYREKKIRIISCRRARDGEKRTYYNS